MAFVGVGGSGTGKAADIFFVDDPYKNDEDAQSAIYREKVWKWFNSVSFSRCHKDSAIIIVHTRWHEDDLIGRLCDPDHPDRHKNIKASPSGGRTTICRRSCKTRSWPMRSGCSWKCRRTILFARSLATNRWRHCGKRGSHWRSWPKRNNWTLKRSARFTWASRRRKKVRFQENRPCRIPQHGRFT